MEPQNKPQDPMITGQSPAAPAPVTTPPPAPSNPPVTGPAPQVAPSDKPLSELLRDDAAPTPEPEPEPSTLETVAKGFRAVVLALFSWIIFPIAIVLILHNFVFQAYHVLGTSMVPTLHETDYLIVSKLGDTKAQFESLFGKKHAYIPARGQIIVFHYPQDPTKVFVKRVIATPGERVVIKGGTVTVFNSANPNGFNPDTKYEPASTTTLIDTDETIQPGNVFVMGDNRTPNGSFDSREWGQLPSSYIIGDAVLRLLPLNQTKIF